MSGKEKRAKDERREEKEVRRLETEKRRAERSERREERCPRREDAAEVANLVPGAEDAGAKQEKNTRPRPSPSADVRGVPPRRLGRDLEAEAGGDHDDVEDQQSCASSQHSSASQTFMGFDQLGILLDWLGLLPVLCCIVLMLTLLLVFLVAWSKVPNGPCLDQNPACALWAAAGECKRNAAFMQANCRLSCGPCFPEGSTKIVSEMGTLNVQRIERALAGRSVLMLGASLSRNAMTDFCQVAGVDIRSMNLSHGTWKSNRGCQVCSVRGFDLGFCQFEGTGEPPYWVPVKNWQTKELTPFQRLRLTDALIKGQLRSETLVREVMPRFAASSDFGHADPDLVLLDSALWDLAKWWQRRGSPQPRRGAQPVQPVADDLREWCHKGVPEALHWVQDAFPRSAIAFQVPPTIFEAENGRSPKALDQMAACIKTELAGGSTVLIDYHKLMDEELTKVAARQDAFRIEVDSNGAGHPDPIHPAVQVGLEYIGELLNHVAGP